MIKICHLTSAHKSNDVRIFEKECSSLAKEGFDTWLVATNSTEGKLNGVNIVSAKYNTAGRFTRMTKGVNTVYRAAIKIDADIYHLHDPELLRIAGKLKRTGKKVIYDAHEDLPRQIFDKKWLHPWIKGFVSAITERYENMVAAKIDGIVAATDHIYDRFIKINKNTCRHIFKHFNRQ